MRTTESGNMVKVKGSRYLKCTKPKARSVKPKEPYSLLKSLHRGMGGHKHAMGGHYKHAMGGHYKHAMGGHYKHAMGGNYKHAMGGHMLY